MKLTFTGNTEVNKYYVQTLCMIYFPGINFSEKELENVFDRADVPELNLIANENEGRTSITVKAEVRYKDSYAEAERTADYENKSRDLTKKQVIGHAVAGAMGELLGYRPSWGILTGVRPSKVVTGMLSAGISKTRAKKILQTEYLVIPKKAALATEVALNERDIIGSPSKKDCSIYVSIPFCPSRCAYCSFVSYTTKRMLSLIPDYIEKLIQELDGIFDVVDKYGLNVKTIYIGGGTPTILTEEQIARLLGKIAQRTDVTRLEEYTFEAGRPDTINAEKFRIIKDLGVSRVSVNPQTLCNDVLKSIGRSHDTDSFFKAYDIAKSSGIKCINTDLIVGLPGDYFTTFSRTYDQILSLEPENITVHTFCVKKASDILKQGSDIYSRHGGDTGKCVDYSQIQADRAGYIPYYMYRQKNTVGNFENVGFAKPGYEGRYNVYMMEETHSIFAAGAGAVTKLVNYKGTACISGEKAADSTSEKTEIERYFNFKYPYEYLDKDKTAEIKAICENFFEALE